MRRIFRILSVPERKKGLAILILVLGMAFLDTVGVASLLPLVGLILNPELIYSNNILNKIFLISNHFGIQSTEDFLLIFSICVFSLLVLAVAFKALSVYAQNRFIMSCEFNLSKRILHTFLQHPYTWMLDRNSGDLSKIILSEVNTVVNGILMPLMVIFAQGILALSLLTLLMVVDIKLAVISGFTLFCSYFLIFSLVKGWLKRAGKARQQANTERFISVNEAFNANKIVKLGALEPIYINRFAKAAKVYTNGQASAQVVAQLPRFIMEAVALGGIFFAIFYLIAKTGSFESALPMVSVFAFAGYRLMPALQNLYYASTQLRYARPALDILEEELTQLSPFDAAKNDCARMPLRKAICLDKVTYCYPSTLEPALKEITLAIPAGSNVALVGKSGSGKTTTADIILGLMDPQEGTLSVDGEPITAVNRRQWQSIIGYVPQQIYLSDDSIAANIAFGVSQEKINHSAVERAARIANLHDFVVNDLPNGYNTKVGERGVRLSGGQMQRVGIARALYNNPRILVFDEATSALDNLTEDEVMDAIRKMDDNITTIMIAHRLSTVRACDCIYLLDAGKIVASGTYEHLRVVSNEFAKMSANA